MIDVTQMSNNNKKNLMDVTKTGATFDVNKTKFLWIFGNQRKITKIKKGRNQKIKKTKFTASILIKIVLIPIDIIFYKIKGIY